MRTNHRVRVAVLQGDRILFIRRKKEGEEYFVLPGGGVESNETPEYAAVREAKEELSVDIEIDSHIATFENRGNIEHYYLVRKYVGELAFIGDEHLDPSIIDAAEWIAISELGDHKILPERIKELLTQYLQTNK